MKRKFYTASLLLITFLNLSVSAKVFKGAEYRTKDAFLYGRFEASFKVAGKEGTLGTMFTYFDGTAEDQWSSAKWNEIDVEIMGRYSNDVQFNTITPGQINHVRHNYVNFNPSLDYHTYAIEWTPDYVAWFIDGFEVYRQTDAFVKTLTHAQKLMFNTWIPNYSNWAGIWNEQVLPAFTFYDWAAYYSYTPGSGNYGTNNSFSFNWRDEFNSFDSNRWAKATHTFEGNNCDFIPENIVFQNGKMILCLTNSSYLGYTDKRSPSIISARAVSDSKIQILFSEEMEKATAENSSQYTVAGYPPTKKALLLSDNRTVELDVEKMNLSDGPTLIVLAGLRDISNNIMSNSAKTIITRPDYKFPLKINAGGSSYKDYISDIEFKTDTSSFGFMEGAKGGPFNWEIANTEDDSVFQSEINGMAKYVVRLPNGIYRVKLLFAENYYSQTNQRIFDVYIQGKKEIEALDIYKVAGAKSALIKTIDNISVNDYLLDIHFAALVQRPLLNGIIIEQMGTDARESGTQIPSSFQLFQNYPNPFNPETVINWQLASASHVKLDVYDTLGREVANLVDDFKQPGLYHSTLSTLGSALSSGVYFYRIQAGSFVQVKKMLLLQ